MLDSFCDFLVTQGKAENTVKSYRQAASDYMRWYEAPLGSRWASSTVPMYWTTFPTSGR